MVMISSGIASLSQPVSATQRQDSSVTSSLMTQLFLPSQQFLQPQYLLQRPRSTDYGHQPANISPEVMILREQFEALREEMKSMALGKNADGLINPKEIQPFPKNLKVPDLEKFDGSSCPRLHIQSYMMAMATKGFDEAGMAAHFHVSLVKPAIGWYIDLAPEERKTWDGIKSLFMEKYKGNVEWKTTRAHVLGTIQRSNESITEFYSRWNAKCNELKEKIDDEDKQAIFLSCIKPNIREVIGTGYYPDLKSMVSKGSFAENALYNSAPAATAGTGYRYRAQTSTSTAAKGKGGCQFPEYQQHSDRRG